MQILERAGELAGVNMSGIGQATKDLTRRLSQAASGTGPAVDALKALNLSANDLMKMPLDERVLAINNAIASSSLLRNELLLRACCSEKKVRSPWGGWTVRPCVKPQRTSTTSVLPSARMQQTRSREPTMH
jgi:hypothetical protein